MANHRHDVTGRSERTERLGGGRPAAGDASTIVAFGDSTTAVDDWSGLAVPVYPDLLPGALVAYGVAGRVVNAGICDTTTRDARERLDRDVRVHAPDLVVVQFGINDSWIDAGEGRREPRLSRDEYRDNLHQIVRTLEGDGVRVVLMTPNPMRWVAGGYIEDFRSHPGLLDTGAERGLNELLDLYAEDVRDVARERAAPLVDVHAAFEEYGDEPGQSVHDLLMEEDGIHPSAAGQRLVCRVLAPAIARLGRG
ncbi:MAG: GDSL-type esterase/lipase family protein [Thermoleophilia bacterium]|jgi:acyl-CoA thioesterase-1|nr:GDSL-type esterase/lipase family protein [Thermoleophilia bacterium]